ncbi:MAG: hypothetical protein MUE69_30935 [Myxococcota bacterium]|nr:hypothetical protein [Myxococcota bacterium]
MRRFLSLSLVASLSACVASPDVDSVSQPVTAYCEAMVQGVGLVDVESDYLPHVVNCENGAAAFEALKAQAVAARTYLYYRLDRTGSIADGTSDQVYSCGREPREEHYEAVRQTEGVVLQYGERTIAGFFVAGARNQPAPDCRGSTDDPTNTERYVTYNEGLSGDAITQTTLGFVHPTNTYNRGCMSQNGGHCLAGQGWGYEDILRFYYGADIEIVRAEGSCVGAFVDDASTVDASADDASVIATDAGADAASVEVVPPPDDRRLTSGGCAASGGATDGTSVAIVLGLLGLTRTRARRATPRAGS